MSLPIAPERQCALDRMRRFAWSLWSICSFNRTIVNWNIFVWIAGLSESHLRPEIETVGNGQNPRVSSRWFYCSSWWRHDVWCCLTAILPYCPFLAGSLFTMLLQLLFESRSWWNICRCRQQSSPVSQVMNVLNTICALRLLKAEIYRESSMCRCISSLLCLPIAALPCIWCSSNWLHFFSHVSYYRWIFELPQTRFVVVTHSCFLFVLFNAVTKTSKNTCIETLPNNVGRYSTSATKILIWSPFSQLVSTELVS
jgi:hypothetical protein